MKHAEGTLLSKDDTYQLFWQVWEPDKESEVKACVIFAHGIGEHSTRYQHVAQAFIERGYAFYALDHRGFGQSEGDRGKVIYYRNLLDDIGLLINIADNAVVGAKNFLYGQSLGGQLVLRYAMAHPEKVDGVIATSPHLALRVKPPLWKVLMAKVLGSVLPGVVLESPVEASHISRDQGEVEAYANDPLIHFNISLGLGKGMLDTAAYILKHPEQLSVPLLLTHGSGDQLTDPDATRQFYEQLAIEDKTYIEYDGLYHEMHHEPEREQVIANMLDWLDAHV